MIKIDKKQILLTAKFEFITSLYTRHAHIIHHYGK